MFWRSTALYMDSLVVISYQAHVELGMETIWCRVRVGNKTALKMHMM
jgi:uncharacterized ParB-like nuclease family protein